MTVSEHAAIVLDIDGTLVDSTYHHALAWQRAFDREHLPVPLWRIHRAIGMGGDKLVAHVAGERVEERAGDRLRELWREEYVRLKGDTYPLPGATDLVRRLSEAGYIVALASSGDPEFAREAIADLGIRDSIATLRTAEDVEESKPHPELVQVTLEAVGARVAVVVGDTPYDVEAAERAGLRCIGLRSGGYCGTELSEAGAVHVADDPADLADLDWEKYLSPVRH
jgi:HAD superfamily hydrolase (TIGR01549 family)